MRKENGLLFSSRTETLYERKKKTRLQFESLLIIRASSHPASAWGKCQAESRKRGNRDKV